MFLKSGCRFAVIAIIAMLPGLAFSGPNKNAIVAIDFNAYTSGLDSTYVPTNSGSEITIGIICRGVKDLDGFSLRVNFNRDNVEFVSAHLTLPSSKSPAFLESQGGKVGGFIVKPDSGIVDLAASIIGKDRTQAPDGDGVLVYVTFKKNANDCVIKLSDVELIDSDMALDKIAVSK